MRTAGFGLVCSWSGPPDPWGSGSTRWALGQPWPAGTVSEGGRGRVAMMAPLGAALGPDTGPLGATGRRQITRRGRWTVAQGLPTFGQKCCREWTSPASQVPFHTSSCRSAGSCAPSLTGSRSPFDAIRSGEEAALTPPHGGQGAREAGLFFCPDLLCQGCSPPAHPHWWVLGKGMRSGCPA